MKVQRSNIIPIGLTQIALMCSAIIAQGVFAHGYVSQPESRSLKCKQGDNVKCGPVQYEPQSVEGPDGFPNGGPDDGKIASAGLAQFSQLNEQTVDRWNKNNIKPGNNTFTWTFTANHVTKDFKYYITKQGWNKNATLKRSSFELTPFCNIPYNKKPPKTVSHQCNVPNRQGYHVILAVWDVGDTVMSFYQAIDVNFNGGTDPDPNPNPDPANKWTDIGDINPTITLKPGDSVKARVFDDQGELPDMATELAINTTDDGRKNNWPYLLAKAINNKQTKIAAGHVDAKGNVVPAMGKNNIYALKDSGIKRVEIQINKDQQPDPQVDVGGLQDKYTITNNQATVDFTLTTQAKLKIDYTIYGPNNSQVAFGSEPIDNASKNVQANITNAKPGKHTLVIKAKAQGIASSFMQQTYSFELVKDGGDKPNPDPSGDYDFKFPEGVSSYKAGTKVLQPKDGKIYQCKPFPYSGYCQQWSKYANQFEPGVGSAWQSAWEAK
ncbi:N-acetylglucosamine-binding protein GbpA [Spartinivicinus poritis]|uniref:N-acetylglucosamine-binding protein GbpA n=1 Tax=Spartinivicinus poritis TaxID=2994640 RepID=A0ABT5U3V6_9GAMM|nr:N-acetylglucosamine-binding protein GbpA [Spartinivicinus sp. A2-2]MDE1461044.1 N-acetylglucosamine-binding protein GbpA [Spartinivicinus sp. A2-2]